MICLSFSFALSEVCPAQGLVTEILKEMEKSKDTALCCGMGGGNMWYELPEGENLAKNRLKEVGESSQ